MGIVSHSPAMDPNGCTHLFHGFCNFALFYRYATDPNSRGGCWFIHLAHLCVAIFGNLSERTHSATTISHGRGRNARRGANSLAESGAINNLSFIPSRGWRDVRNCFDADI